MTYEYPNFLWWGISCLNSNILVWNHFRGHLVLSPSFKKFWIYRKQSDCSAPQKLFEIKQNLSALFFFFVFFDTNKIFKSFHDLKSQTPGVYKYLFKALTPCEARLSERETSLVSFLFVQHAVCQRLCSRWPPFKPSLPGFKTEKQPPPIFPDHRSDTGGF